MTTRPDDRPEFDPDDPLAVMLRPTSDRLGAPPRRYEAIRRDAARRRLLRAAAGVGLSCAAAALVALPLHLATTSDAPASPTVPLAPPPASSPSLAPTPPPPPDPVSPRPSDRREPEGTPTPTGRTTPADPSRMPTATPSQGTGQGAVEPSAVRDRADATPEGALRP